MKSFFATLLLSIAVAPAVAQFPLTCSADSDCTEGRPKCCSGTCLGCCSSSDCPTGRTCKPDGTCINTCFSGETVLDILGKGTVSMKDAEVGDKVLTKGGDYESVYAFGHREPETEAYFLQIYLDGRESEPLEITRDHLLLRAEHSSPVPASTLKVGDQLSMADGTNGIVSKIAGVSRTGIYAPLSQSGLIAVNNVLTSNYVSVQDDSPFVKFGHFVTPITWHWVSHAFQAPHRMICGDACLEDNNSGSPFQIELLGWVSYWVSNKRSALIQYVVLPAVVVPVTVVLGVFQAVELLVNNISMVLLTVLAAVCVMKVMKSPSKKCVV